MNDVARVDVFRGAEELVHYVPFVAVFKDVSAFDDDVQVGVHVFKTEVDISVIGSSVMAKSKG